MLIRYFDDYTLLTEHEYMPLSIRTSVFVRVELD
jgi:hypothetical protein